MIRTYNNIHVPIDSPLLNNCDPVKDFNSKEIKEIILEMNNIMNKDDNVYGIAANQLGYDFRMLMMKHPSSTDNLLMINPRIEWTSNDSVYGEEGCLSFPGLYIKIKRPDMVTVGYQDSKAGYLRLTLEGIHARIVQHEIDHLDGKPFFKKATSYHLEKALKEWKKYQKQLK